VVQPQTPFWHSVPAGHTLPQVAQLASSLAVFTQRMPQRVRPLGQAHAPSTQFLEQQDPSPLQAPPYWEQPHWPSRHCCSSGQGVSQAPQWLSL
jgi:hypothetical protein